MATIGRNMKLTIASTHRPAVHALFTEVLGSETQSPSPNFQLYLLADGFNLGVYFTDDGQHLADDDWDKAPWLEFLVSDVEGDNAALRSLGLRHVPYDHVDPEHVYWQIPGGPVFRLAGSA